VVYPQLIAHPHYGPNVRKLEGYVPPTWCYRIGPWRFFYEIDEARRVVSLTAASPSAAPPHPKEQQRRSREAVQRVGLLIRGRPPNPSSGQAHRVRKSTKENNRTRSRPSSIVRNERLGVELL